MKKSADKKTKNFTIIGTDFNRIWSRGLFTGSLSGVSRHEDETSSFIY